MPILFNIVCCFSVVTVIVLLAPTVSAQLGDDPKYLTEFECNDKHKTKIRFRCSSVKTDQEGKKLCVGDDIILNAVITTTPYDPCQYSTCLGVKCLSEYPHLMQLYGITYDHNFMIARSSKDPRCGCSASLKENAHNPTPPLYVFPDSPESQPDDQVCKLYDLSCSSKSQFAHSPNGSGEDCECCDKPTDKLHVKDSPSDGTYTGCVPNDVDPPPTNPNNEPSSSTTNSDNNNNNSPDEFVSIVHKMCGSSSATVTDDVLTADVNSFCCTFATGSRASTASCGMDVVRFVGSFTVPAEAQCQFNVTDHPFSCCATVGAQGNEIVNKGAICTSGSGGRGDGALHLRSSAWRVASDCIMLLSVAWIL